MGSSRLDDQFTIQIFNTLTKDNELQMLILEKRIGNKENPLTTEELKADMSLRFERLSQKSESTKN